MGKVKRILAASILLLSGQANAALITVGIGTGFDFSSIQAGINAASSGDTIMVAPGQYVEGSAMYWNGSNVGLYFENKSNITLQSTGDAGDTFVDFNNAWYGLMFNVSNGIDVSGFTFSNSNYHPVSIFNGSGNTGSNSLSYTVLDYRNSSEGYIQNYENNMSYDHITFIGGNSGEGMFTNTGAGGGATTSVTNSIIANTDSILWNGNGTLSVNLDWVNLFDVVNNATTSSNMTYLDPQFVDFALGDFHLSTSSQLLTGASEGSYLGALGAIPTVPEPATIALFGLGLAGIGFSRRRKR